MTSASQKWPEDFAKRLRLIVPPGILPGVQRGYLASRLTTFRLNTLKATEGDVMRAFAKTDLVCEPIPNFSGAYTLKKGSFKKLTESRPYVEGWIYVQSLSSQIPPLVLMPRSGEMVLDMAAAPGGKTCQMAALMQGIGEIIALEPDKVRFERLKHNVEKQGATIVRCLNIPGEKLGVEFESYFDRVLLDAPCSSEGTFCLNDRTSYAHWSVDFVAKMAKRQKKLLTAAWRALKPGGLLVYSTCAMSPEENEEVVDFGLKELPECSAVAIPLKHSFLTRAMPSWNGLHFAPGVTEARRIYPSEKMEGFFVAALRKSIS